MDQTNMEIAMHIKKHGPVRMRTLTGIFDLTSSELKNRLITLDRNGFKTYEDDFHNIGIFEDTTEWFNADG